MKKTIHFVTNVALLIIDIQNDYFEGGNHALYNPLDALSNAENILKKFRDKGLPVIHVQHFNSSGFFVEGTEGAKIHENLTPLENETLIIKHQPSSFAGTELEEILKEKNISELVICGMQTNVCVEATSKAGKELGFQITLLEDACAALSLEKHNEAIKILRDKYADIIKTSEFNFEVEPIGC